jgi:hypothetical protein
VSVTFTGTVQSLGQSPEPGVEADERTALVHVEQALDAPDPVDISPGTTVVVQLAPDAPVLEPGERATFVAEPLVYGNTLVVREVSRGEPEAAEADDDEVVAHARAADAVVRGVVRALRALPGNPQHEHDPQYWLATFDVDVVALGDVEEGELDVLYANSLDRRWRAWPKPKAGESGMWILHRTEGDEKDLAGFVLRHPEDLQPSLELDELLGEAGDDDEDDEDGDDTP